MCHMQNSLNFDKTLLYLTALTPMKSPFFVFFGFIYSPSQFLMYLLQTFMWFCIVNTPVTLVSTFIKSVGQKMSLSMAHHNQEISLHMLQSLDKQTDKYPLLWPDECHYRKSSIEIYKLAKVLSILMRNLSDVI